ncbi:glycerophosphodiester phosphodiesterase family protein [Cohnella lubricantis]|uniref:Glycerophosphodiester phosphodiesterase n=1 Tax=Cohnella lubricantis TaxID=2163172 RepID=A0A841TEX9_9BACL|nr:glycerophosphodiester phosphodiesterase family protein [Cohnella lubricantis]MBB6679582.1 glycerophosphodiester phosphodiesterase [Cohnella lubricantis]MBP2120569.1 glycerophosphoryl diester phosphodiesterase [Cohnella lubricantis]
MAPTSRAALHPCVAHRGWSGGAPENTLAAFRLALSEPSVYWIELDVHLSKDEVPVVIHDGTLNRTTNGKGKVSERTALQLSQLDAGSWFHPIYAGEPIPTLAQVMSLVYGRACLNIELKEDAQEGGLLVRRVVELVRAYRMESAVVITSFDRRLIEQAKKQAPEFRTGLITDKKPKDLIPQLQSLGASVLSIDYRLVTPKLLAETATASIGVMAWTVNQPGDLARLASMPEPFQICTNYPDRWLAAVAKG